MKSKPNASTVSITMPMDFYRPPASAGCSPMPDRSTRCAAAARTG
jgi:hypothetical protein